MEYVVQLATSSICTARCKICPYHGSFLSKNKAVMTDRVFEKIVGELKRLVTHIPKMPMYMQNEPLTDPSLFSRIERVKAQLPVKTIEVSTNCSLLTEERAKQLIESLQGIRATVILSFHEVQKERFEEMTGLSFDKCLANLKRFLQLVDNTPIARTINSCGNAKEFQAFWKKELAGLRKPPRLRKLTYTNRAENLRTKYAYKTKKRNVPKCRRHKGWLHFNWQGDLVICCNDYEQEVVYGNIMETDLKTLIKKIPRVFQEQAKKPNFICKRCEARHI